jgi:hypothetical protein
MLSRYAECRYAWCRYAECCGAEGVKLFKILTLSFNVSSINDQPFADASNSRLLDYHYYLCPLLVRNLMEFMAKI